MIVVIMRNILRFLKLIEFGIKKTFKTKTLVTRIKIEKIY